MDVLDEIMERCDARIEEAARRGDAFAKQVVAQRQKGRFYVTRARNIHLYRDAEGFTLVDSDTGSEIVMDADMALFIANKIQKG